MIDYAEIEKRWQKAWQDAKVFEPEPNEKEGFMVINAFPYVNAPFHVGHYRAYGTADTYARYLRMRGYNVLFPFGFHATGTPLTAFARRIAVKDRELFYELEQIYHIPHEEVMKMTDPAYIADYMIKRQEAILKMSGLGIDWERKFTTIDPLFSKMIEWQFNKLYKKGYLIKGEHPVAWCTLENHAVGENDTKGDVHPKIEEIVVIKFKDISSDVYFPCATYRPETIYGATNIFVNQELTYNIAEVNGARYYMSKDAVFALANQLEIKIIGEIKGSELLSKKVINPVTKEEIPVLPGFFVKADVGTGIVMSVPSHAPFDYVAIERLKASNYPVPKIEYKKIIDISEDKGLKIGRSLAETQESGGKVLHPEIPALAYLELLSSDPNALDSIIEKATKLIYKEESRWGVMLVGKYAGKKEVEGREGLKKDLVESGDAFLTYEIANEEQVLCKDGTVVVVKVVNDQWFINYGDKAWKEGVRGKLSLLKIYPPKLRATVETAVDWLDLRAAERAHGLGTKFPLNPDHIIESLSDSTIYMVFYTFIHLLRSAKVTPEQLKPKFFDYVLCSMGGLAEAASDTGIDEATIKRCKESFEYWYKKTSSHTATEHIFNHITMYLYNHQALLPEQYFPKQVAINGMLLYEGEKMSKSLGNLVPLEDGIAKYGADQLRAVCIASSELDSTNDFVSSIAFGISQKNEFLIGTVDALNEMSGVELDNKDYWLYSKLNTKIKRATEYMDDVEFRGAFTEIFYNSITELKLYLERGGKNQIVIRELLESVALMLSPIMPHFSEELWHMLGNNTLAAQSRWPTANPEMINEKVEEVENIISSTIDDINNAIALTSKMASNNGKMIKEIKIIIAEDWKRKALNSLIEKKEIGQVIREKEFANLDKEMFSKFLSQFMKKIATLHKLPEITSDELYAGFVSAKDYIKKKNSAEITIEKENLSKSSRASRALPGKPGIEVVWE